jgi:hypothetical protein
MQYVKEFVNVPNRRERRKAKAIAKKERNLKRKEKKPCVQDTTK